MRRLLYILWQCSWGSIQSLAGAVIFLVFIKRPHRFYHGAVVTEWSHGGSISLGMFVFLSDRLNERRARCILAHEYGHTIQSLILGPLYLPVIGLPSVIWAGVPAFSRMRKKRNMSYYRLYTERWANHLGRRTTGEDTPE